MGKNNSVNLDITNNSDGFDISGGTTSRKLSVTGGDITLSGSGSATITFPTTSTTVAGLGIAQAFTATQSFAAGISVTGATFNSRANFAAGLTTANLFVTSGATFNSLANFAAGLTTANLFVTSGATFGTTINAPNIVSKWSVITADQTAEVNNGYLTNKGTLLTLTLPTTAAVGSMLRVSGMNAGLWKIAQNASQVIHFGKTDTTTGTGGFLLATQARDSVELVCCVANNEWNVISSVGNIDYT